MEKSMENNEEEQTTLSDINGIIEVTPPPIEKRVNGEAKEEARANKCSKRAAKEQAMLMKKKDERSLDMVKKALGAVSSPEEKLALMCDKYAELFEENRKLVVTVKAGERKLGQLQREKEQLQADHSKVVLTRSRLESLCRELQRQNKAVKDESLGRIREEEEKRKELSARFNVTLNEITTLMQQNTEKNNKLRDENRELAEKFKTLCEQYELREQQVEKLLKQNQLETKLSETKLAKAKECTAYQMQVQEMQKNETALRSQITMYSEKYDEFQQALGRSNEVFNSFKVEMEKICRLEKETSSWKTRWEKSHQALLEMAADKQQKEEEMGVAVRQMAQLQKLCRTLQEERTKHIARLRELGEDIATKPEVPAIKSEPVPSNNKSNLDVIAASEVVLDAQVKSERIAASDDAEKAANQEIISKGEETTVASEDKTTSTANEMRGEEKTSASDVNTPVSLEEVSSAAPSDIPVVSEPPTAEVPSSPDKSEQPSSPNGGESTTPTDSPPDNKKKLKDGGRKKKK
ncbi:hypothetical protein B566_EDAN012335 [Ephemera danica]|nr:hypothetical protein B566_EDAN012335 [Ephemera danica]